MRFKVRCYKLMFFLLVILGRNYSSVFWKGQTHINEKSGEGVNNISSKETKTIKASRILKELCDKDLIQQHVG